MGMGGSAEKMSKNVGIIATTNSTALLDMAAQRPGRFDKIILFNTADTILSTNSGGLVFSLVAGKDTKIIEIVNDETLSEQEKVDRFGESFVKLTQLTIDVVAGCVESIETPEGTVTDTAMIKEFIENSSSETFNAINERVHEMKEQIALKSETVECQHCQFKFGIDITMDQANFFAVGS
jgi:hypothetical protein